MHRRLYIGVILFVLLLCGCYKQVEYPFLHEQTEISSIEIVMVGEPLEQGPNEQIVFVTIDDIDSFMEKLKNLNCYKHVGDPIGIWPDEMAVKIIYSNGEYELINEGGQAKYTIEKGYNNFIGHYCFDDEQFKSLLAGYLGTDVQKADSYFGDAGDVQENSTKSVDDVITYYTLDDFQSIVVGESTAKEVSGIAIKKGVNGTELFSAAEGLLFRFPMENGQHICVDVTGADSKVSSIEIK